MKIKKILLFLPLMALASNLGNINPVKKNDSSNKPPEQGWRFGDNPDNNKSKQDLSKKTIKEILLEMLKVQKKQLKTQKKILAILQNQFDPKPKIITLPNGKKCVANSSAECFQMPLTPTAKRIPVLKNWLLHRDEKSAAAYIKWQSKYLNKISKAAYAYNFAVTEFGSKVANVNYSQPSFEETFGETSVLRNKFKTMLINKLKNKFDVYIFLGESPDLDIYSFTSLANFINKHPNLHYTIIFKTKDEKKAFFDSGHIFHETREVLHNKNVKFVIMPSLFKTLDIYSTPTISIKLKNSNIINKVLVGRPNGVLEDKIINYLTFKNVIKPGDATAYKVWKKVGNYAKPFYKNFYGVNVGNIIKTYKEQQK